MHRLSVESKLTSAGFDILLSRMEEWSYPDDGDFLNEFLHGHREEVVSKWVERLSNQPIYLMVLERVNAVQTWLDLMGSDGDEVGKSGNGDDDDEDDDEGDFSFNSFSSGTGIGGAKLRTIYGKHLLYGSVSPQQAERQIAICAPELASPEAIAELELSMCSIDDDDGGDEGEVGDDNSQILLAANDVLYNEQGQAFNAKTGEQVEIQEEIVHKEARNPSNASSSAGNASINSSGVRSPPTTTTAIKARPLPPASLNTPRIQPRLSRAAALRMGVELPPVPKRTVVAAPAPTGPVGISGLPKTAVAKPKSLAEPTVKPRANRASLARTGGGSSSGSSTTATSPPAPRKEVDFSSTPGHRNKRSSLSAVQLASLRPPTIAPRTNKAAMARVSGVGGGAATTSHHARSASASLAATSGRTSPVKHAIAVKQPGASAIAPERRPIDFSNTPGHKRASLSGTTTVAALAAPKIVPRTNLAAMRRLSHGGVAPSPQKLAASTAAAATNAPPAQLRARPASSLAFNAGTDSGSASANAAKPSAHRTARPSSSAGVRQSSLPHQDGAENTATRPRNKAPPSSFRLSTAV